MGLHQNGYRDNVGVFRYAGLTASNGCVPSALPINTALTGSMRNMMAGEGFSSSFSVPDGVRPPHSWVIQRKSAKGSMTARIDGITIGTTGAALAGYPITGTLSIEINMPDAVGQAIASGTGTASFTINCSPLLVTSSINGTGTATFTITGATSLIGAEASIVGTAPFEITATLDLDAYGLMEGSTVDSSVLTSDTIAAAVWSALAASFNVPDTMGNKLNTASSGGIDIDTLANTIVDAILADPSLLTVGKFLGLK